MSNPFLFSLRSDNATSALLHLVTEINRPNNQNRIQWWTTKLTQYTQVSNFNFGINSNSWKKHLPNKSTILNHIKSIIQKKDGCNQESKLKIKMGLNKKNSIKQKGITNLHLQAHKRWKNDVKLRFLTLIHDGQKWNKDEDWKPS